MRCFWIGLLFVLSSLAAEAAKPAQSWRDVVRATPYWESQGVARNLKTIRYWVLLGSSYCAEPQRHILFDRRLRFLGYLGNGANSAQTQTTLNNLRQRLYQQKRVPHWRAGSLTEIGYPFALACDQPHVNLPEAIARMTGDSADDRVWGTWGGLKVGTPEKPVALAQLIEAVYNDRSRQGTLTFPKHLMRTLLGQVLIESGALKDSRSLAQARGLMQLTPGVLRDCGVRDEHALHRMAQVDCALRLYEQNHRVLNPVFENLFGHLPQDKRRDLYGLLLVQAYHGGVGRVRELLQDPELGGAGRYFAQHHARFSAADMALGMIYHNLGRKDLGFASLYYVADVSIAADRLCQQLRLRQQSWCKQ